MSSTGQEPSPATEPARPTPPEPVCPFCSQRFSRADALRGHLKRRQNGGTCARVPVTTATEKCEVCLKLFTGRGLRYHVNKRLETGVCPRKKVGGITMAEAVDEEGKNGEVGSKEVDPDIVKTREGGLTLDTGTAEDLRPVEASDSLQARTLVQTPTDSGTQQNLPFISTVTDYQQKNSIPSWEQKCPTAKKGINTCLYPHCFASFSTREGMLRHMADHGERHNIDRGTAKNGTTRERCTEGCNMSLTHVHAIVFEAHLETKHAWSFRYREGAMMHFKTFHGLAPIMEESTEVRMADEETQSSAETMAGT
ncbi:MAG: hypothetical protein Q9193_006555, partial [Seirophora villosa]